MLVQAPDPPDAKSHRQDKIQLRPRQLLEASRVEWLLFFKLTPIYKVVVVFEPAISVVDLGLKSEGLRPEIWTVARSDVEGYPARFWRKSCG